MIVVAIIAIVAGLGIPKFQSFRRASIAKKRMISVESYLTSIDSYVSCLNISRDQINGQTGPASPAVAFNSGDNSGVWAYLKGGKDSLNIDGEAIAQTDQTLNTEILANGSWVPYSKADAIAGGEPYLRGSCSGLSTE